MGIYCNLSYSSIGVFVIFKLVFVEGLKGKEPKDFPTNRYHEYSVN